MISCLCVTYRRAHLLERAIDCFRHQTYPDKELIILYQDDDEDTRLLTGRLKDPDIRCFEVPSAQQLSLGAKRNLSVSYSRGEYFCIWDDDDWCHPGRLGSQLDAILVNGRDASVITTILLYDAPRRQAYMSFPWPWEGTILCRKSLFEKYVGYREIDKGEDSYFLRDLVGGNHIYPLMMPHLYIYVYTGLNTWDHHRFKTFFGKSQRLSEQSSLLIGDVLDGNYSLPETSTLLPGPVLSEINYLHWTQPVFSRILQ